MTKKICRECKTSFEIFPEDENFYSKIQVPAPSLCPICRQIAFMNFRNERNFYRATCKKCSTSVVSCFSPNSPLTIWCTKCWWSDNFDPRASGRDFDFNRPFFDQFWDLMKTTPLGSLFIASSENSDYSNYSVGNKNCYMISASDYNEDCFYTDNSNYNRDTGDVSFTNKSELIYESIDVLNSYMALWCENVRNCNFCYFCVDCIGCENCIGCVGLRNAKYHIFNKPYSEDAYKQELAKLALNTWSGVEKMKNAFQDFKQHVPRRFTTNTNVENCVGNYITNCKNCFQCFDIQECENLRYVTFGYKSHDVSDGYGAASVELCYQVVGTVESFNVQFTCLVWPGSSDVYYSFCNRMAKNCLGGVALNKNEYCILNKQYSKAAYEELFKKIKAHMLKTGEWGEYFPGKYAPWAYNETVAFDFYPKSREEVLRMNARWEEKTPGSFGKETLTSDKIPESLHQTSDKITDEILACLACSRNFKIISQEFAFYKKMNVPLPRHCPACRYQRRIHLRNPRRLLERKCAQCQTLMVTTYGPDRTEKILCELCYQKIMQ